MEVRISATPTLTGKLFFFYEWCKRCGICEYMCPSGALALNPDNTPYMIHPERCTLCSICWRICPDFAVLKNPNFEEEEREQNPGKEESDAPTTHE